MRILVACEFSGIVRDAFAERGHDAVSCDLLPTEKPGQHIQDDVLKHLNDGWDMMIAHPPCTHLAVSGAAWFHKKQKEQKEAIGFCEALWNAPIKYIVLENPVGVLSTKSLLGKPTQIIQPYQFGEPFQKTTCLWLKNLRKLEPTKIVDKGEFVTFKSGKKMAVWYASLRTKKDRAKIRSKTFQGIADAMAEQWGSSETPSEKKEAK